MKFPFALLALFIDGCATSPQERYSQLQSGMTKQQVIALLGQPKSSTSSGALITMEYDFAQQKPGVVHAGQPARSSYYVIIGRDERVRSFGPN
jgi:outer membrane protein assembly factor BamE (lipoprotein component of BamABCDE complex)